MIINDTLKRATINKLLKENNLFYFVDKGKRINIRWWQPYPSEGGYQSGYSISQNKALEEIGFNHPKVAKKIKNIINSK